jgi:DNA-directed RNA polymerase specialized sigma subunit
MTEEQIVADCIELGEAIEAHRTAIKELSSQRRLLVGVLHRQFKRTYRQIGPKLGISAPRVSQIMNGANWRTR